MALKFILPKTETPPEGLSEYYNQDGEGRWILQVDGAVPKAQIDEFRENNVALKKQIEAFKGADPKIVVDLIAKKEEIEAAAASQGDKVKKLVEERAQTIRTDYESRLNAATSDAAKYRKQLAEHRIDAALVEAGEVAGLRPTAREDLILRGRQIFSLDDDGQIVALDADGTVKYSGVEPLSPKGWVSDLAKSAEHLFDPSSGAGAAGGGKPGAGTNGVNPFAEKTWNMTAQGKLIRENPEKAKAMAAQAGVVID